MLNNLNVKKPARDDRGGFQPFRDAVVVLALQASIVFVLWLLTVLQTG